jgi:hypothetical protein
MFCFLNLFQNSSAKSKIFLSFQAKCCAVVAKLYKEILIPKYSSVETCNSKK